jgi:hypothetical protein
VTVATGGGVAPDRIVLCAVGTNCNAPLYVEIDPVI